MRDNAQSGSERGWLYDLGCDISAWVSDVAAHPYAQFGLVLICVSWFALGLDTNLLTAALSILAITLTQMVLNRQNEREAEAHRRDVAMHAKLDELIIAVRRAHNEMAGIEELPEDEIAHLKEHQQDMIDCEESSAEGTPSAQNGRAESPR
jgi:low affinity Fe/Cu permease